MRSGTAIRIRCCWSPELRSSSASPRSGSASPRVRSRPPSTPATRWRPASCRSGYPCRHGGRREAHTSADLGCGRPAGLAPHAWHRPDRSDGASLTDAAQAAALAISAVGADGHGHLTADIRADRAVLRLQSAAVGAVTGRDIRLAHEVSGALAARGLHTTTGRGSLQLMEIAIDALDIPAVRPFWK